MRLTVFGATSGTGTEVIRQAIDAGHQVTAVVGSGCRLALSPEERLRIEEADVTDPEALIGTLDEADAALSALRHRLGVSGTFLTQGIHAILSAMEKAGARRLVAVSSTGPFGQADARRMEELIAESPADWTIMRPPRLAAAGLDAPGLAAGRAGLADATLKALGDPATIGHHVSVGH